MAIARSFSSGPVSHDHWDFRENPGALEFRAGRAWWKKLRNLVRELNQLGYPLALSEGPGWLARRFEAVGDPGAISILRDRLLQIARIPRD